MNGTTRVLITAGAVFVNLDANKIVSNRVRGIWAIAFAEWLTIQPGYEVTLLIPDTMPVTDLLDTVSKRTNVRVVRQSGFQDYSNKVVSLCERSDAAVLAAAVVNWIPAEPYAGKMPTDGYEAGDIIQIPFVLAPRVIDLVKKTNPRCTLIGCKMLVGSEHDALIDAAYHVLLRAHCNMVIANDMGHGLKQKYCVYPDRTVVPFDNDFEGLYREIQTVIDAKHYRTELNCGMNGLYSVDALTSAADLFDRIVTKYAHRFVPRTPHNKDGKTFGSLAVRIQGHPNTYSWTGHMLCSPREKGRVFGANDGVIVVGRPQLRTVRVADGTKATMNAPLLSRMLNMYPQAAAVLHLHEELPWATTEPYYEPGTDGDSERMISDPTYNIKGHGFIACLDGQGDLLGFRPGYTL